METNFYKLSRSLDKFRAFKENEVGKKGFYAEINSDTDNNTFCANIYLYGELSDLQINNWTFSYHIEGTYSNIGNNFKIYAIDPNKKAIEIYNTPYYRQNNSIGREEYILCSFLDLVFLYSHFEDAEIANNFNLLLRSLECGKSISFHRYEDKCQITPGVALVQARFFKEYYTNHIENEADPQFMNTIKNSVNKVVEVYKEEIDSYKI